MKKPNVTFLAFFLALSLPVAHAAAPVIAGGPQTPASDLAPTTLPATSGSMAPPPGMASTSTTSETTGDLVPLPLTPEAMSKVPSEVPINLSRWYTGATLVLVNRRDGSLTSIPFSDRATTPYSALLEEDSSQSVPLETGTTSIIIDFHAQQTIERFGFFCFTAAGSVDVKYATTALAPKPNSADWKPTNVIQEFNAKQVVSIAIQPLEARFLLITFKITTPGDIGSFSILGHITSGKGKAVAPNQGGNNPGATSKMVDPEDLVEFDYATAAFGTKVTHILGGNVTDAQKILTSDPTNKLLFGEKSSAAGDLVDTDNIMVVDMGQNRDIDKVALLFATKGNGRFEFYFMNDLPTEEGVKAAAATAAAPRAAPATPPAPVSWRRADGTVGPLLLATTSGSLAEVLALSQLAAVSGDGINQVDYLPKNFFADKTPNIVQNVSPDQEKLAVNFDKNNFRYCLIRWQPSTPNQPPIEVFRVNLIGRVPLEDYAIGSTTTSENTGSTPVTPTSTPTQTNVANLDTPSQQGSSGGGNSGGSPTTGTETPDPPQTPPTPRPVSP